MLEIQPDLFFHADRALAEGLLQGAQAAAAKRGLPPIFEAGLGLRDGDATLVVGVRFGGPEGRALESETNFMLLRRVSADRRDALVAEMAGALAEEWDLTLAGEI